MAKEMSDDESVASVESTSSDVEPSTLRPRRDRTLPQKLSKGNLDLEELHYDMTSKSLFTL